MALMTAELGSMIPDVGGPIIWVQRAFGPLVAHLNAIVHLVAGFFDLALYPVIFSRNAQNGAFLAVERGQGRLCQRCAVVIAASADRRQHRARVCQITQPHAACCRCCGLIIGALAQRTLTWLAEPALRVKEKAAARSLR
jgi:amino acid transporter